MRPIRRYGLVFKRRRQPCPPIVQADPAIGVGRLCTAVWTRPVWVRPLRLDTLLENVPEFTNEVITALDQINTELP
jgi:hypothetical protein